MASDRCRARRVEWSRHVTAAFPPAIALWFAMGIIGHAIGALADWVSWRRQTPEWKEMAEEAAEVDSEDVPSIWFLVPFFIAFDMVLGPIALVRALMKLTKGRAS